MSLKRFLFFIIFTSLTVILGSCATPPVIYTKIVTFQTNLSGKDQVPPNNSLGSGTAKLVLQSDEKEALLTVTIDTLAGEQVSSYIHTPSRPGSNSTPVVQLSGETIKIYLDYKQVFDLKAGLSYITITSTKFKSGELRGQLFEKQ